MRGEGGVGTCSGSRATDRLTAYWSPVAESAHSSTTAKPEPRRRRIIILIRKKTTSKFELFSAGKQI